MTRHRFGGFGPLFRKRSFVFMWVAQTISNLGDGVARIALLLLVTERSHSALALTLAALCQAVPAVLLGPVAGVIVDRANRKHLMAAVDLARAVVVAAVIAAPSLNGVYVLSFFLGVLGTFFNPARSAAMPEMAGSENYVAAVSLNQLGVQTMTIIGPALGGVLVGVLGSPLAFAFDALTFVVSAVTIMAVRFPEMKREADKARRFSRELGEGLRLIWREKPVRFITGVYIPVTLIMGSLSVLMVDYLRHSLSLGPGQLGLVEALLAAGLILATVAVGQFGEHFKPGHLILNSIGGIGLASLVFLLKPGPWLVALWAFVVGAADGLSEIPVNTLLLRFVPNERRGRVFASFNAVLRLSAIVSMATAGPLAARFGSHIVLGVAGVGVLIVSISGRWAPGCRALNAVLDGQSAQHPGEFSS